MIFAGWMAYYRLYFMDLSGGHIEQSREFGANDDADAMMLAQSWATGQPMELWERDRKVKAWEATSGSR